MLFPLLQANARDLQLTVGWFKPLNGASVCPDRMPQDPLSPVNCCFCRLSSRRGAPKQVGTVVPLPSTPRNCRARATCAVSGSFAARTHGPCRGRPATSQRVASSVRTTLPPPVGGCRCQDVGRRSRLSSDLRTEALIQKKIYSALELKMLGMSEKSSSVNSIKKKRRRTQLSSGWFHFAKLRKRKMDG